MEFKLINRVLLIWAKEKIVNILLVYPKNPETYWSFKHALKFISKKAAFPPLGLLTVAAMLPDTWQKKLVDMNVSPLRDKDIQWADYVFISAISIQRASAEAVINKCRQAGVKIVAGGPLFTTAHSEFEGIDHFILNEAEITLPPFLHDLSNGHAQPLYSSEQRADITQTPAPQWDLINMKKYATMSIQYSRGCPFNCDFCDITSLFGKKSRCKSAENILGELDLLYQHGWRGGVFFVDDNFIGNQRGLKTVILPAIADWINQHRHAFSFMTQASINLSDDDELMAMMVKAGFDTVFIGIESPHEESLSECSKTQNKNRDLIASIKKCQHAGLQVQGGFIVGFDNDPLSIFDGHIKFIQKSGIVTAMVGLLNAIQGTRLHQRLENENRLVKTSSGDNTDCSINFIPKMNLDTLIDGYKKIVSKIYSPAYYYTRVINFLKEYQPPPKQHSRLNFRSGMAFFKSIFLLGIIGKERRHYWKLLSWSLFQRPSLFPLAVTFAIYGFNYRKVFEKFI